jgi:hypothetical protein
MDAEQFRQRAEMDERLSRYLELLSEEAAPLVPERTAGLDLFLRLLSAVTARALYLTLQGAADGSTLQRRLEQQQATFGSPAAATADVIVAVSRAMAIRPPDDETLEVGARVLKGEDR